jgi:AraC-like DNA-binding protein
MLPLDQVLFSSSTVRVGAFRCPVGDPRFRDSGPIQGHLVAFPRTAVWITQAGSRAIVADQRVVTIYNRGREYRRAPLSPSGDRCDWFSVAPEIAVSIAREHDPLAPEEPERTFRFEWAASDPALYLRQRRLFHRLERNRADPLEVEEEVLRLVGSVLSRAVGAARPGREPRGAAAERRELADRARAELARAVAEPTDVASLAARLGSSPYHLCRVFRKETGLTLHAYRLDLRLRAAMEQLAEPGVGLSRLAFELGFSSHSHFTAVLRSRYGVTPTACQAELLGLAGRRR